MIACYTAGMPGLSAPQPVTARRSRFKRAAPSPLRLTNDDLVILRHIAKHRFLRSTHLARLLPHRSYKKLLQRLGELYHNGFVDRPRAQLDYYAIAGSAPIVYALGNRGALALAEHDGMDRSHVDWTWKNRSVGRLFIEHTLLTADVMVAAKCTLLTRPDVLLVDARQILAAVPDSTRAAANPFKLQTRTTHEGKLIDASVIPDAVFGLDFTHLRKRKYFFLEADRATMPIVRADFGQTSYARKLLGYLAGGGKSNVFGTHFGIGNFRVLTVTTSVERTASMIDALKRLTGGTGSHQFLFLDRATLRGSIDLLSVEWITGTAHSPTLCADNKEASSQKNGASGRERYSAALLRRGRFKHSLPAAFTDKTALLVALAPRPQVLPLCDRYPPDFFDLVIVAAAVKHSVQDRGPSRR